MVAPRHLVAEPRLKLAVLFAAGIGDKKGALELDPMRYASHVSVPVLMLNGQFDTIFRFEEQQLPFFERFGSSDKHLETFPTGHNPPVAESVSLADNWLSKNTD